MALNPVLYGNFNLNDGMNFFVVGKSYGFPAINPSMFKIGRLEGMKKVGENINERKIKIDMRILGTSRADLEDKIDNLLNALFNRNQQLVMHSNDNRYFVCDCLDFQCDLATGNIISTTATVEFIAYQPFAYSALPTIFDTGVITMPLQGAALGSTSYSQSWTINSGGNVFARPSVRIYQRTPVNATTMTGTALIATHIYGSITCAQTQFNLNVGDDLILSSGGHTQSVVVAQFTPFGSTTINVGGFSANFAYPAGTTITRDMTWGPIQINQTTDQQVLQISTNLPTTTGDYLDINCDPLTTNGYTVIKNGSGVLSTIAGSFPVLEDGNSGWTITIQANSVPQIQVVWTWQQRWIS
jgi:predicted phage tail component-like protein